MPFRSQHLVPICAALVAAKRAEEFQLGTHLDAARARLENLAAGEDAGWIIPERPGSKTVSRAELHSAILAVGNAAILADTLGEAHLAQRPASDRNFLVELADDLFPDAPRSQAGVNLCAWVR
jgi:hypothetical protein